MSKDRVRLGKSALFAVAAVLLVSGAVAAIFLLLAKAEMSQPPEDPAAAKLPFLRGAGPGAGRTPSPSCQTNLKQLSLAVMMYVADYDERFPLGVKPPSPGADCLAQDHGRPWGSRIEASNWAWATQPYLKNPEVLGCPSATAGALPANTSYLMSEGTLKHSDPKTGVESWPGDWDGALSMGDMKAPAASILFYETDTSQSWANHGHEYVDNEARSATKGPPPLHNGGGNYAFRDGHVKWVTGGTGAGPGLTHGRAP